VTWTFLPPGPARESVLAGCTRVGVLMSVIWLAYREIERLPEWLLAALPIAMAVIAARPKAAIYLVPLVVVLVVLNRPLRR
jgi:hypothetical protein